MADPSKSQADSALAADWLVIWQSEWAAAAVDRELGEAWLRFLAQAGADAAAPGPARPVPPARASAAADAPDARDAASLRDPASASLRDAVITSLLERVAELERRAAPAAGPAGR